MIILAIVGTLVNLTAAVITHKGESLNQKAVNLHMLEDVLGWIIVLIGAVVMRLTEITVIDPILSIAVALFVFINAVKTFAEAISLLLEKTPKGLSTNEIKNHLSDLLNELRESPKAENSERIYTHGEKEHFASIARMKSGIEVDVNTVTEMVDLCCTLDMNVEEYLGKEAAQLPRKKSTYQM